jgi:small subunit ribosomal protein S2
MSSYFLAEERKSSVGLLPVPMESQMIDVKDLIEAGVHFGHKTSKWSPKMSPFIWGARNKVHLIDVSKTAFLLNHACNSIKAIALTGKTVLWVGTKKPAQASIRNAGTELSMPAVYHRWIGGTLTNFDQVKKAVKRLLHLRDAVEKPLLTLKKKEIVRLQKEVGRLEKNVGGIVGLKGKPALLVVVDAKKERTAIKEAVNSGIPVIGIVDTNTNPEGIDIIIPSNDDSPRALSLIINQLVKAAGEGASVFAEKKRKEKEELEKEREAKKVKPVIQKAPEVKAAASAEKPKQKEAFKPQTTKLPLRTEPSKPEAPKLPLKTEKPLVAKALEKKVVEKPAVAAKVSEKKEAKPVVKKPAPAKKVVASKATPTKAAPVKKAATVKKPVAKSKTTAKK